MKINKKELEFTLKQFFYFKVKIKKIKFKKLIKNNNNKKYVFIFFKTNGYVQENKKILNFVELNQKQIIEIDRYYFDQWIHENIQSKKIYIILNNCNHFKYEYHLIRNNNVKSFLIDC